MSAENNGRGDFLAGHPNLIIETLRELCLESGLKFKSTPEKLSLNNEWDDISCTIFGKKWGGRFFIQQMPGCCAVLILHHIQPYAKELDEAQEISRKMVHLVETAGYRAGFGSLMMVQVIQSGKERDWGRELWILSLKDGWRASEPFINAKSGNMVMYLTKNLEQPGKRPGFEVL